MAFKSLCWIQIKVVSTLPQTLKEEKQYEVIKALYIIIIRYIPIPPNFNNTAAKIIEPPRGASTCAFGNHKWKKNIGNFTRKAKILTTDHTKESVELKEIIINLDLFLI